MNISQRIDYVLSIKDIVINIRKEKTILKNTQKLNEWFTSSNIELAFKGILNLLDEEKLRDWISNYHINDYQNRKRIGIIGAGNIPLVIMHDCIIGILSGHIIYLQLSHKDNFLPSLIINRLKSIYPYCNNTIFIVEEMPSIDAIIVSGSNNTIRYIDYIYKDIAKITRKSRRSCAVLHGMENKDSFRGLTKDCLSYFGLGCRNVSTIYIPLSYCINSTLKTFELKSKKNFLNPKYRNNFNYNKAYYNMLRINYYDNGYLLLKEDNSLNAPIGAIHYCYYNSIKKLREQIHQLSNDIQCIVSEEGWFENSVPIGRSQYPNIDDYPDNIDTMKFLIDSFRVDRKVIL